MPRLPSPPGFKNGQRTKGRNCPIVRANELIESRHPAAAGAFVRLLSIVVLGAQNHISRPARPELGDDLRLDFYGRLPSLSLTRQIPDGRGGFFVTRHNDEQLTATNTAVPELRFCRSIG